MKSTPFQDHIVTTCGRHQGIEFPQLVSDLIDLALTAHAEKNALTYTYTTNLLSQAGASFAKLKKGDKLGF